MVPAGKDTKSKGLQQGLQKLETESSEGRNQDRLREALVSLYFPNRPQSAGLGQPKLLCRAVRGCASAHCPHTEFMPQLNPRLYPWAALPQLAPSPKAISTSSLEAVWRRPQIPLWAAIMSEDPFQVSSQAPWEPRGATWSSDQQQGRCWQCRLPGMAPSFHFFPDNKEAEVPGQSSYFLA